MFDSLLNLEEEFAAQGRLQGLQDGETQGTQEGYSMGLQQGEQIGKEIGFYVAICEELSKIVQDHKSQYSPRLAKTVLSLLQEAIDFPPFNDHDKDLIQMLKKLRARFTVIVKGFKLDDSFLIYGEEKSLSQDLSY